MGQNKKMEVFSNLRKLEPVHCIADKIVPGSVVFESLNPFPGYYHEVPGQEDLAYLYIALDRHYSLEKILRATREVEIHFDGFFDAGKGFLSIADDTFWVLRLRHFGNYDQVAKIQEAYASHGIGILLRHRKQGEHHAHIKIVKFLYLDEIGEGLYLDLKEKFHGYIGIPKHLDWDTFEEVTRQVKYNWMGSEFDAATGSFFYEGKLHDYIRVFSKKLGKEYLDGIRDLYLEKIK